MSVGKRGHAGAMRQHEGASRHIDVGDTERLASKIGGGLLVAAGLKWGGFRGLLTSGLGAALLYRGFTGHCHMYQTLGVNTNQRGPSDSVPAQAGIRVEEAITIERPPEEVYRYWRDYANLPRFMEHIVSVTGEGPRSHWVARTPTGQTIAWDAELIEDRPGELIAWRSVGGDLETAGSVHFLPAAGGRGTQVHLNQKLNPPGGKLAIAVAKLFQHGPERLARASLRNLKQILEAGELATTQGQPSGPRLPA
jgi:uncharacterized membrane protein